MENPPFLLTVHEGQRCISITYRDHEFPNDLRKIEDSRICGVALFLPSLETSRREAPLPATCPLDAAVCGVTREGRSEAEEARSALTPCAGAATQLAPSMIVIGGPSISEATLIRLHWSSPGLIGTIDPRPR